MAANHPTSNRTAFQYRELNITFDLNALLNRRPFRGSCFLRLLISPQLSGLWPSWTGFDVCQRDDVRLIVAWWRSVLQATGSLWLWCFLLPSCLYSIVIYLLILGVSTRHNAAQQSKFWRKELLGVLEPKVWCRLSWRSNLRRGDENQTEMPQISKLRQKQEDLWDERRSRLCRWCRRPDLAFLFTPPGKIWLRDFGREEDKLC